MASNHVSEYDKNPKTSATDNVTIDRHPFTRDMTITIYYTNHVKRILVSGLKSLPEWRTPQQVQVQLLGASQECYVLHPDSVHHI